jgi:hypothetical protein
VALCQARTSTKPLWGLSSSNPYHPSHVPNRPFVCRLHGGTDFGTPLLIQKVGTNAYGDHIQKEVLSDLKRFL